MTEKKATTAIILSIIAILISAVAMTVTFMHSDSKESESLDTQYVLYLGTNDKDTNQPVFTPEKALWLRHTVSTNSGNCHFFIPTLNIDKSKGIAIMQNRMYL